MLDRLLLGRVILKIAALEVGLIALKRRGGDECGRRPDAQILMA